MSPIGPSTLEDYVDPQPLSSTDIRLGASAAGSSLKTKVHPRLLEEVVQRYTQLRRFFLLFLGPPGSGKSSLGHGLEKAFGFYHLSGGDAYRAAQSRAGSTYRSEDRLQMVAKVTSALRRVVELLGDAPVSFDGFLPKELPEFEEKVATPCLIIKLICPEKELLERMEARVNREHDVKRPEQRIRNYFSFSWSPRLRDFEESGLCHELTTNRPYDEVFQDLKMYVQKAAEKHRLQLEAWDDQYFSSAPSPSKHIQAAPRARTAPGDTPKKTPSMQRLPSKEPEKKEKSLKSKLKEAFMKQMNDQRDVMQEMTSEATRSRRRSSDGGLRFQHDPSSNPSGDDPEEVSKKGLWRLHHKESKRSRLYRVTACRRNKDQSEQDIMTGYRDRVHRYEVEVAQESFLRHFPAKQGNPWRNDDILEALADFGIKAQSRTEKIALKTVLSEHEDDEFGFNTYCSIIEEARCKLRGSRTHTVFQSFKYADTEDLGGLSVTGVMKMLQNLNLTFEKGSEERQTVEAMANDCRKDPATGLIGLSEVEFLVSAVREFMVQSKRRRERELKVEYQLPEALFQQFRSQLIQFHVSFKDLDDDDSGKLDPNEAMNLLTHFGCITSGMPLEKKLRAQAIVSRYLLDAEEHLLSFDRFLCVVQDLRVLGMEEKVEIVETHFNQYDRDQSGLLTIKEICQILMDLKIQPRSLSEQEAMAQLIEEADSNGSGTLSVEDLLLLVQRILERIGELNRAELLQKAEALGFTRKQAQALWETFEALDASQDGLMDVMEVGQALSLMKWQMSAAKLERHIMALDADGNGQLDFVEFLQLMRRMLDDVQAPAAVKIKTEEPGSPRRPEEDGSGENTPQRRGRGAVSSSPAAPKKRS